ncbi:hypothetical protein B0F90DRAFT_1721829 [Multifurca ochricompacta]|uniref:Uncharacterized protein n=1 Tax=Multifurca ochricompacta TaxID=376703 RepID=A0AAD4M5U1_9AGAM|nr:hypothetical protein B0F90DRAFT_1721829 [Multifurca ochricompacta]
MNTPQVSFLPADILVDGFISRTFTPEDANYYLMLLLRAPVGHYFLQYYGISYQNGGWYITQNAGVIQQPLPGIGASTLLLDCTIRTSLGTVVPQNRWAPSDEVDIRRHVEGATLQLPVFFVNQMGGVGFWLPDILQGRDRDLYNGNMAAPLGGRSTTHIRINWPGYVSWRRQIPTRDETRDRKPITLARFMKHIGTSVDRFFKDCAAGGHMPDGPWRIGADGITHGHVKVIGAVHVSAGSWMPIMQLTEYVF